MWTVLLYDVICLALPTKLMRLLSCCILALRCASVAAWGGPCEHAIYVLTRARWCCLVRILLAFAAHCVRVLARPWTATYVAWPDGRRYGRRLRAVRVPHTASLLLQQHTQRPAAVAAVAAHVGAEHATAAATPDSAGQADVGREHGLVRVADDQGDDAAASAASDAAAAAASAATTIATAAAAASRFEFADIETAAPGVAAAPSARARHALADALLARVRVGDGGGGSAGAVAAAATASPPTAMAAADFPRLARAAPRPEPVESATRTAFLIVQPPRGGLMPAELRGRLGDVLYGAATRECTFRGAPAVAYDLRRVRGRDARVNELLYELGLRGCHMAWLHAMPSGNYL